VRGRRDAADRGCSGRDYPSPFALNEKTAGVAAWHPDLCDRNVVKRSGALDNADAARLAVWLADQRQYRFPVLTHASRKAPTTELSEGTTMTAPQPLLALAVGLAASLTVLTTAEAQAPRPLPAPAAAQPAAALPGGATSLQETHGDWVVGCVVQAAAKRCGATQEQTNQQTRQRVIAMELAPAGDRIEGALLLPFGLVLDQGVALQIDDQALGQPLRFRTCLPGGCLVPLSFDARQSVALRGGTMLKSRIVPDGGQPTVLTISLKGLGSALDRTATLAR